MHANVVKYGQTHKFWKKKKISTHRVTVLLNILWSHLIVSKAENGFLIYPQTLTSTWWTLNGMAWYKQAARASTQPSVKHPKCSYSGEQNWLPEASCTKNGLCGFKCSKKNIFKKHLFEVSCRKWRMDKTLWHKSFTHPHCCIYYFPVEYKISYQSTIKMHDDWLSSAVLFWNPDWNLNYIWKIYLNKNDTIKLLTSLNL